MSEPQFVEHCWAIVGEVRQELWCGKTVQPTTGTVSEVDFDGQWVLDREENDGDIIGFYHTHPSGTPNPSTRDVNTMRAWVGSFGKPLLCLIEADNNLAAFRFDDDQCDGVEMRQCELFFDEVVVACDLQQYEEQE